jgi:digeranylgeranylglycerophospholipid reductase
MKRIYDVAIVGGGPVGSYSAYQLADKSFDVCILDEKEQIGKNVICTGIVSKEAFKRFDLPTDAILSRIDSFTFVSPLGQRLEYSHPDVFAYVVSREKFDNGILKLAKRCGTDVHLKQRVSEIKIGSNYYTLQCGNKNYQARSVVLATGVKYDLHRLLGIGKPQKFLYGSQIELPVPEPPSTIEIHIGNRFAPGSFGWIAPINKTYSRIGVVVEKKGKIWLERMLTERINFPASKLDKKELKLKPIANSALTQTVKDKIIVIGEAAGQVKTTTGGGILYGLMCSTIAVDKLSQTLKNGKNALNEYEITWRSALSSELEIGQDLRATTNSFDDDTIENLFTFVKKNKFWVQLLLPRISYDFHSNFLFFCLKSFQSLLGLPRNSTHAARPIKRYRELKA